MDLSQLHAGKGEWRVGKKCGDGETRYTYMQQRKERMYTLYDGLLSSCCFLIDYLDMLASYLPLPIPLSTPI